MNPGANWLWTWPYSLRITKMHLERFPWVSSVKNFWRYGAECQLVWNMISIIQSRAATHRVGTGCTFWKTTMKPRVFNITHWSYHCSYALWWDRTKPPSSLAGRLTFPRRVLHGGWWLCSHTARVQTELQPDVQDTEREQRLAQLWNRKGMRGFLFVFFLVLICSVTILFRR